MSKTWNSYTTAKKLEIVEYAKSKGNRSAASIFEKNLLLIFTHSPHPSYKPQSLCF